MAESSGPSGPLLPPRVVAGIVCVFVGLLVDVIAVGLIRDQIDPNGLALALLPAITGVIVGAGIRAGRNTEKKDDEK